MTVPVSPFIELHKRYHASDVRVLEMYMADKCRACALFNGGMCTQPVMVDKCVAMAVAKYSMERNAKVVAKLCARDTEEKKKPSTTLTIPRPAEQFESLDDLAHWLDRVLMMVPDDLMGDLDVDLLTITLGKKDADPPPPPEEQALVDRLRLKVQANYMSSRDSLREFEKWLLEKDNVMEGDWERFLCDKGCK